MDLPRAAFSAVATNPDDLYRERVRYLAQQALRLFLIRWFQGQAARVIDRFSESDRLTLSLAAILLPSSENVGFSRAIETPLVEIVTNLVEAEIQRVRPAPVVTLNPRRTEQGRFRAPRQITVSRPVAEVPRIRELVTRQAQISARRVVEINNVTRRAIREQLRLGIDRGYTRDQLAQGVPADEYRGLRAVVEETYRNRAQTIARTELQIINNRAQVNAYKAMGYKRVRVYDSAECGLVGHDDPRKPANTVININAAIRFAISHPRCIRRFVPVIADE